MVLIPEIPLYKICFTSMVHKTNMASQCMAYFEIPQYHTVQCKIISIPIYMFDFNTLLSENINLLK